MRRKGIRSSVRKTAGKKVKRLVKIKKKRRSGPKRLSPAKVKGSAAANPGTFEEGYQAGYQQGVRQDGEEREATEKSREAAERKKAYDNGMTDGIYTGGDGVIDTLLPEDIILPEISAVQVMQAGIEQMRPHFVRLLQPPELAERIIGALNAKTPLSIVRLGDGELLTLAQDTVLTAEQVQKAGPFLGYAGVHVPDLEARNEMLQAIRNADVVGIPKLRLPHFQPLAFSVLRATGIDYRQLSLTDSLINYKLYVSGHFSRILQGRHVLAVGNLAEPFAEFLAKNGVQITGAVAPVAGVRDVPRVMEVIRQNDNFDIALISAGISAVMLVQQVATQMGKVAIDFGHLADSMLKGESPFF